MDYQSIPSNCRTNNFLENYNGYIKTHLGKNRYINWVNFIHFIKTESQRNLNKLHENANLNILTLKKNEDKNIIKDIKIIELEKLLTEYFKYEILEFETICENCKKILNHKKDLNIVRPPKILILSLQRINFHNKVKNECIVKIPENLDIKEFIDIDFGYDNNSLYELYSIINHIGKIDFDHYYSYIKLYNDNLWYEFDDSNVKLIGKELIDYDKAYILFYINKKNI